MIVLGIDPGYARLGYGIIEYKENKFKVLEYGTITTQAHERHSLRLKKISEDIIEVIKNYNIDSVAIEDLYFNNNAKTAIKVAEARGVILYTIESKNIPIAEYTPLQVKQALVGYGRADKLQIKEMVKHMLKIKEMPKLDDTTDALAMAICHIHSATYNTIYNIK